MASGTRLDTAGLGVLFAVLLLCAGSMRAQVLRGEWVERTQDAILEHRRTALRVIVLDANGQPVEAAPVAIRQVDHDFQLGFRFDPAVVMLANLRQPVARTLTAVTLDPLTAWPKLEPEPDGVVGLVELDHLWSNLGSNLHTVRWGTVVSSDPARNPGWLVGQDAEAFAVSLAEHTEVLGQYFGKRADGFDVVDRALDHRMLEDRLGETGMRRLFQEMQYLCPGVPMHLRLRDALLSGRDRKVYERVTALQGRLVPLQGLTLEQRFSGTLNPLDLERSLLRMAATRLPIVLTDIEVTGRSPVAAAINLETVLRLAFAEPSVQGVYFANIRDDGRQDEDGAGPGGHGPLLNANDEATVSGETFEGLFRGLWWTTLDAKADELGNVYADVFAGRYLVSATLPDGQELTARVHAPLNDGVKIVVLQPLKTR